MPIPIDEVRKIADLSKLTYEPGELERFIQHFQEILDYLAQLDAVNAENVPPTYHALEGASGTPLRPDEARSSLPRTSSVANAPQESEGQFRVPKVIE